MRSVQEISAALDLAAKEVSRLGNSGEGTDEEFNAALGEAEALEKELRAARSAEFSQRLGRPEPQPALRRHEGPRPVARRPDAEDEPERAPGLIALSDRRLDRIMAALPFGGHRLQAAAGDLFREGDGPDGGFILPADKRELQKLLDPPATVHGLVDVLYTNSNAVEVPVDEDPDWSADLGAVDLAEGEEMVEDKAQFKLVTMTLGKSGTLVRVTREMLEDAGFGQRITAKLSGKLAWKLHTKAAAAFLTSPAKVTVAKTNGAGTLPPSLTDVQTVWTRMFAGMRARAVWMANPQLETVMQAWTIGQVPVYVPPGGLADAPLGRLFGRPVFFVEGMPAVGTAGDIALVDPMSFWGLLKTAGPRIEESIHAEFKKDVVLYRALIRSHYVSKFSAPIVRPDGTTAGNCITIATRT